MIPIIRNGYKDKAKNLNFHKKIFLTLFFRNYNNAKKLQGNRCVFVEFLFCSVQPVSFNFEILNFIF